MLHGVGKLACLMPPVSCFVGHPRRAAFLQFIGWTGARFRRFPEYSYAQRQFSKRHSQCFGHLRDGNDVYFRDENFYRETSLGTQTRTHLW